MDFVIHSVSTFMHIISFQRVNVSLEKCLLSKSISEDYGNSSSFLVMYSSFSLCVMKALQSVAMERSGKERKSIMI